MWHRVFARSPDAPAPDAVLAHAHAAGFAARIGFRGDDLGWFAAAIELTPGTTPLLLDRYLAKDDDLRDDLNSWAAWLETQTHEPNHAMLMERVIQSQQLFTLRKPIDCPDDAKMDALAESLCRWLASASDGIWQADGRGFFAADGAGLLREF